MLATEVDKISYELVGKKVTVDSNRPELARMIGKIGLVKAVNFNLRALVQFENSDPGWYDIDPEYLKIVK
jgi:hypothetical protein